MKSLIIHGRIETTVRKGKELKREADKLITTAKKGGLTATRADGGLYDIFREARTASIGRCALSGIRLYRTPPLAAFRPNPDRVDDQPTRGPAYDHANLLSAAPRSDR